VNVHRRPGLPLKIADPNNPATNAAPEAEVRALHKAHVVEGDELLWQPRAPFFPRARRVRRRALKRQGRDENVRYSRSSVFLFT